MSDPALWIALIFSLVGCLYAAWNIALRTFNRSRLADQFDSARRDTAVAWFVEQLDKLLLMTGTLRIGANMVVLLATMSHLEQRYDIDGLPQYLAAFIIAAVLVSIFGLAIPVSLARYVPEALLSRSVLALRIHMTMFAPAAIALHVFDPIVRRMSGADIDKDQENRISEDVLSIVEEHENGGEVDPDQRQMIEAVFDLPNTFAGEIMTPRTEIQGIPDDATLAQVKSAILEAGHSRIPVYHETIDEIVGILYAKDLIRYVDETGGKQFDLQAVLRDALMVPESKSVRELLSEFRARKVHIAIVLDEYGGTAGLVTIEDILEELVGEIQDEYEDAPEEHNITRVDEYTFDIDARVDIDDLNDQLELELPEEEDYETLGGFVFSTLGHVPDVGEKFDYENVSIEVLEAERTRVKRVRLTIRDASDDTAGERSAAGSSG